MAKLAYIIAYSPGTVEEFFIPEMLVLKELDVDLKIIPRDIIHELLHLKAKPLLKDTLSIPWFNLGIVKKLLQYIYRSPFSFFKIVSDVAFKARSFNISMKNLIILPKALYLSGILEKEAIFHIHAHWGNTTATMAHIVSRITNIPWSFTLHSGEIIENNILKEKVKSASFVRCISENRKADLLQIVGNEFAHKIKVIHMGVDIPDLSDNYLDTRFKNWNSHDKVFKMVVPASLLPVKGHKYLIEACSKLVQRDFLNYKCIFYGDGPLKKILKKLIAKKRLTKHISLHGRVIPNEKLMSLYNDGQADMVVLPSIINEDGQSEGIPVSLMEAMSYAIPVISTKTGSIHELISSDAGILVKPNDPKGLADAILRLAKSKEFAKTVAMKGRDVTKSRFSVYKTTELLMKEIQSCKLGNEAKLSV